MKNRLIYLALLPALLALGCQKVHLEPENPGSLLPLKVGNSWTYVDSVTIETTEPHTSTAVQSVTYRVEEEIYADYYAGPEGDRETKRMPGYRLSVEGGAPSTFGVFQKDGKLFASTWLQYGTEQYLYSNCDNLRARLLNYPQEFITHHGSLICIMSEQHSTGDKISAFPGFREREACVPSDIATMNGESITFDVYRDDLTLVDANRVLSTPAGTFTCYDWGTEQWAEGVGMIRSEMVGNAVWIDPSGTQQTGTMTWVRTLTGYTVQ